MDESQDQSVENIGPDKAQVEQLAQELAEAKRLAMESQHRLNEVESGRIFRSIRFLKKSLVNPVWAIKNTRQFFSLFRKIEISPLPDNQPTAKEYLEGGGIVSLPPSIKNSPRTLKYPQIKVASIGDPGLFSKVCHSFMVDKSDWKDLLALGIDFLLVTDHKLAASSYGKATIKSFRSKNTARALVDDSARLIWLVENQGELDNAAVLDDDIVISIDPSIKRSNGKIVNLAPWIDITVHNPVNWLNKPKKGLMAAGQEFSREAATKYFNSVSDNFKKGDFLAVSDDPDSDDSKAYKKFKIARAVVCELKWFDNEQNYLRTIFRLAAAGIPIVTSGSKSIKTYIGKELELASDKKAAKNLYQHYSEMKPREIASIKLRRYVMNNHSALARFESLLEQLNIERRSQEKISIIMSTMRQKEVEHGIDSVATQKWQNKELILILHRIKDADFDIKRIKELLKKHDIDYQILDRPRDSVFGDNLNLALEKTSGEYVTKMDDDDYYGPNHLDDLYLAYQYSGAMAVGKWANFIYLTGKKVMVDFVTHREERFVRHLPGATVFMRRSDLRDMKFGRVTRAIDSELYRRAEMRGGRLYSTHRYNFIRVRHSDHTYAQDEEDFIANASSKPRPGLEKNDSFI